MVSFIRPSLLSATFSAVFISLAFIFTISLPALAQNTKNKLPEKKASAPVSDTIENFDGLRTKQGETREAPKPFSDMAEEATDASNSEPLPQIRKKKERIDPHFSPESHYIEHPNAAKGLMRIDKEKVYYYRVKSSDQREAASFRIGSYEPSNLTNPKNSAIDYDSIYSDGSSPILLYDYERQFFQKFGKLSWKLGTGLFIAKGNGQFENPNPDPAAVPKEKFTFVVFPFSVGATYRLQFWESQFIVPYAEGGADAFAFAEHRDDDQNPGIGAAFGIAPAAHFSVGGAIQLGRGARSFLDLDREYGINSMWVAVEFRSYAALSDKYDFSGDVISAGILAEY